MGISDGDRAKMAAARTLIQERRYQEAKALLRGVSHPKAREWLGRLESMPAARGKRKGWAIAIASIAILLVVIVVSAGLIIAREGGRFVATQTVLQTATAANATLAYLNGIQEIEVGAALTTYCATLGRRSQGDCRRWSDGVLLSRYVEAKFCNDEYDWIYDTDSFSGCLLTQGIAVLGEQALITPIDLSLLTEDDIAQIAQRMVRCQDENPDDYCYVWALMSFTGHDT